MTKKNSRYLIHVIDAMEDGIYITNHDYTVEFMNRTMVELFGKGIGKHCYKVVNASEVLCPWCRAKEVFENGDSVQQEIYIPRLDKTFRIIEMPLENDDGTISKLNIYRDITARRNQERKLKATEQEYHNLFEHVDVGVYISSKEGRFIDANRALLDMLGYDKKSEFLKMNIITDLYVQPADRRVFQRMIEEDRRVVNYPVYFKRKDSSTIPVLLTAHVRTNHAGQIIGYEGICVDQSKFIRLEKKIKETHDFLNNIIQSSPNPIIGADLKGKIIVWNQGAEETLGYSSIDAIGKMDVRKLYPESMAYDVMRKMRSDEYGGPGKLRSFPMAFKHKDNSIVEGNLSASLIYDESGRETASVGFFVDLEERLAMERKLHHTQEQLLQSEKLAAMGRLTSQLAHELNNPLYGIMNTLELMKTEISPQNKRRKLLEMALSEIVRLTDMLRKMLSFSKPDQELRTEVNINTILDEILILYNKQLREHDIKIKTNLTQGLRPIKGSKNQIRQVFINMINNAKDAMPEGGTLTITSDGNAEVVRLQISDTGTGIKAEHMDHLFDTFFTTKTDSARGVGLGLSVCYGFIKDHGGDIKVESQWGQGTTFTIVLPAISQ